MDIEFVMIVGGKKVYVGDRLFFTDIEGYQHEREVLKISQDIILKNPKWVERWSWVEKD